MGFSLKKLLSGDNPFAQDKRPVTAPSIPSTANSIKAANPVRPQVLQPASTAQVKTPNLIANAAPKQNLFVNNQLVAPSADLRSGVKAPEVKSRAQEIIAKSKPLTFGAGALRSAVGTAQGLSGLYDLATPGTGTNRFSDRADIAAKNIDQQAKFGNNIAYKGGQLTGDLLTGGAAGKAVKVPAATPKIITSATEALTKGNFGQRVAGQAIRGIANPALQAGNFGYTALDAGKISSRGNDVNPLSTSVNLAVGGLGLPVAGAVGREALAPVVNAGVNKLRAGNVIAPSRLAQNEVDNLRMFSNARGTNAMDEQTYNAGIAAAQRAGIDPNDVGAIDNLVTNHQIYNQDVQNAGGILQNAGQQLDGMFNTKGLAIGGSIKRQGLANDLSPQQNEFIADYAEMLKSVGQGNGVDITADGRRVSNNFRGADDKGKSLTNTDWFDRARAEIESGKAAYGASDEFATLPQKQLDMPAGFEAPSTAAGVAKQPTTKLVSKAQVAPTTGLIRGKAEVDAPLPIYNTNKVSNFDKAVRSTGSIIKRQGKTGEELSEGLENARSVKERYLGELEGQMPTVMKLARGPIAGKNSLVNKEFENFVDAVEGNANPINARVAQAVQEWRKTAPTIRERGVAAGLDIGDLGETYYPHFNDYDKIFKDQNMYNQALNHLVESGQAANPDEAMKLLSYARDTSRNREFGNLEAARTADLPFYDKSSNSLISYLTGSARRIANTEQFGKGDEKALKLITQIGKEGGDTEAAKNAYDIAVGARNYNPTTDKISGNIRKYVTTTRLGLGALTNVSQNVNTGIVTGHTRTLLSAAKALRPEAKEFAREAGVISEALLNDIRSQRGDSFSSKVLGQGLKKITAPGFGAVEKFNRTLAATAGRDYGLRLAQKGKVNDLRKLGVKGEIKGNTLTNEQQIQVAREVVKKTQFKTDPQDLPGWADSPGGKLVAQFRTFSYKQQSFMADEVIKPALKGNVKPAARLLASLPVGYALYESRRAIDGRQGEENGSAINTKEALASFGKVGGAGIVFDLYQSINPVGSKYIPSDRRTTMVAGALGGPAIGVGLQGAAAASETVQRKSTPDDLTGKVAVGNTGEKYTDATPISRFGLSQVPIVGTPIKNRLLPYKKESDAINGKLALNKDQQEQLSALPTQAEKQTFLARVASGNDGNKGTIQKKDTKPGNTAVDQLKKVEKAQNAALKGSLSDEDYKLSKLGKADRQKLIDEGSYTQKKFDGLDGYVKNQKQKLGIDVKAPSAKDGYYKSPDAEYKELKKTYDKQAKKGFDSVAKQITADKALAKAKAGSTFSKEVRDLYGLSDDDLYNYVSKEEKGKEKQKIAEQVIAYGDKLAEVTGTKNKFRNKKGEVTLGKTSYARKSGGSSGKAAKKKANASITAAINSNKSTNDTARSNQQALQNLLKGARVTGKSGGKKVASSNVQLKKQTAKKKKVRA